MRLSVSENLSRAFEMAEAVAKKYGSAELGTEHILYGLLNAKGSLASGLLADAGVQAEELEKYVFSKAGGYPGLNEPKFTNRVQQTLLSAQKLAQSTGSNAVGTEHMLYCMMQDTSSFAYSILVNSYKINVSDLMTKLKNAIETVDGNASVENAPTLSNNLNDLGVDLTQRARENKIDPIIGRKEEIERIIQILCRKTKNNPVLIGEPGVGKSAVVEGLSKAIVEGNVPELLKNKIVFSLDMGSLMAGTKYRGALEEKLKEAINSIKAQQNIIVFIDELHTLAQSGSKDGEVSPADILKPYLARGELQTIGATTTDEYRKFIEADKALERRFQPITVAPPSVEDTIEILHGLRENYEAFHKVKISDEALEAAAKLSDRYIMDRFLPDKAIDLVDEAMSKAKVTGNTPPSNLLEMEEELKRLDVQKQEAVRREEYKKASELRDKRAALEKQINELKLKWTKSNERSADVIGADQIAEIVAKWTKIPVTRLTESETQRLVRLEEVLHKRVIGQDEAVVSVSKAIRRARAGLKDPGRPIGTFLFLGPTGVGKTELTKALSEAMFDDDNAIIRLDMSEYMESHSVSKLIGAPPGYVGFSDGGQLTEQVRRKPYSVVLFDEIEKAHPDVYNILLQILDDGRLTDAQGRLVSFKNTLIIMTSNVGVGELKNNRSLGFSADTSVRDDQKNNDILMGALKRHFKPEFLNRIDVISVFHALNREHIEQIAVIMIQRVQKSLSERGIKLKLTDGALRYLIDHGYDPEYGARPLRRVIEQMVEDNVAEALLDGTIKDQSEITVDISPEGKVCVA